MDSCPEVDMKRVGAVLEEARKLAWEYYQLTGKPLGITGEMAEYEAARLLGMELCAARQKGYDALWSSDGSVQKVQIKGRCVRSDGRMTGRVPKIRLDDAWDTVVLVVLDGQFEARHIYAADRPAVEEALRRPGSAARNERGQLGISQFVSISRLIWPRP